MSFKGGSAEWVERVRHGEEDAFRLLFDRYAGPLLGFLYPFVGQRELAEDLVQETFVRAYANLPRLRDPGKLSTWLFGIARNVAREAIRVRGREGRKVSLSDLKGEDLPGGGASPETEMLREEMRLAVIASLQSLGEDRRLVFVLRVFREMSYEEIGEVTGFSLTKIKSDLHRAREEMRRRVRPYLEYRHEL